MRLTKNFALINVASFVVLAATLTTHPQHTRRQNDGVPDTSLWVTSFRSWGSGCPEGSYTVTYAPPDRLRPNQFGLTASYDQPFYLYMIWNDTTDQEFYQDNNRAERFCRHEVSLQYPVGCIRTSFDITTNGIFLHDVPDMMDGSIDRQFELGTGTWSEKQRDSQSIRAEPGWGYSGKTWTKQDWVDNEVMIVGHQDEYITIEFAVNITLAMWAKERRDIWTLEDSYMRVDDTTMYFIVDGYSPDCWGTGLNSW